MAAQKNFRLAAQADILRIYGVCRYTDGDEMIAVLIAGFLSGIIGAMGLGGGAVLIIYLSVIANTEQLAAQGINLIFFIPIGALAVTVYSKKGLIKWKRALTVALGGLLGALLGVFAAQLIGGKITAKIFGSLLTALGLKEVFCKSSENAGERN